MLERLTLPTLHQILGPAGILCQRPIGIGFVLELLPRCVGGHERARRLMPILRATRSVGDGLYQFIRLDEFLLQALPVRTSHFQFKGVTQEIVFARVLVQTPHEVADGVNEIFPRAGRRVEQQAVADLQQRAPLVIGHPFKHFELKVGEEVVFHGLDQGEGDFKQIMRGDPQPHRLQVLELESFEEHAFEVGIRFQFGFVGSLRPAAERRFDPLHLQIRTLHQADHDRLATVRDALLRPLIQLKLGPVRVGDIRLQRDAGRRLLHAGPVERFHERFRRDAHVPVLFHVQVHELGDFPAVGVAES